MTKISKTPLIPAQIRAGRALINWSQQQLADAAGLSLSSIRDYENERRGGIVGGLGAIKNALENEGIAFLVGDENEGPGVRLSGRFPNVLRRPTSLNEHDALLIPIVWRGTTYELFVHRDLLDDLAENSDDLPDSKYGELFDQYRAVILSAATKAIDARRFAPDRRVHLVTGDI